MKRRTLTVTSASRIEAVVRDALETKRDDVLALVARGAVYLDGKRVKDAGTRVGPGQKVMVVLEESGTATTTEAPPPPPLSILFEDADVLAVNKPWGVTAQPTEGRVGDSLLDLASAYLGHEAGLVHRLDRQTSGVTVFGKHAKATSALAKEFRDGTARKEYLAVCPSGLTPAMGTIDLPLSKDPSRPGRWRATKQANGIDALTHYERLSDDGTHCVVALFPQTGRTHQLRAHLTALGFPILGDTLYGGTGAERCLLHARRLELPSFELKLEAPIPPDMARWVPSTLGK